MKKKGVLCCCLMDSRKRNQRPATGNRDSFDGVHKVMRLDLGEDQNINIDCIPL